MPQEPTDWPAIIQDRLDQLPELPCRVDEMTVRERKIFEQLADCVGFLQFLKGALEGKASGQQ